MVDAKNKAPAEGPKQEQRQTGAIQDLRTIGRTADLMSEIIAHEAARGKDPVVISSLQLAIFPTILAGILGSANEQGGIEKIRKIEQLLKGWDS